MLLVDLLEEPEASLRPAFDSAALEGLPIVITSFRGRPASLTGGSDKTAILDCDRARSAAKADVERDGAERRPPTSDVQ